MLDLGALHGEMHRKATGFRDKRVRKIFISLEGSLRSHAMETIFSKIINREIPADIVYEDDICLAFRDVNPQAPMHILVIPKQAIPQLSEARDEDREVLGHLLLAANRVAASEGYGDAYRLIVNNGEGAGQTVFHLHVHILGGRGFTWPPG